MKIINILIFFILITQIICDCTSFCIDPHLSSISLSVNIISLSCPSTTNNGNTILNNQVCNTGNNDIVGIINLSATNKTIINLNISAITFNGSDWICDPLGAGAGCNTTNLAVGQCKSVQVILDYQCSFSSFCSFSSLIQAQLVSPFPLKSNQETFSFSCTNSTVCHSCNPYLYNVTHTPNTIFNIISPVINFDYQNNFLHLFYNNSVSYNQLYINNNISTFNGTDYQYNQIPIVSSSSLSLISSQYSYCKCDYIINSDYFQLDVYPGITCINTTYNLVSITSINYINYSKNDTYIIKFINNNINNNFNYVSFYLNNIYINNVNPCNIYWLFELNNYVNFVFYQSNFYGSIIITSDNKWFSFVFNKINFNFYGYIISNSSTINFLSRIGNINVNIFSCECNNNNNNENITTLIPTTEQPSTLLPTTIQPTTEQPSTLLPTTEQPSTLLPTTEQPTTEQPTTEQPTTIQPTTEQPTTEQPSTIQPTTEQPTTEQPSTLLPTTIQPTTLSPTTLSPTTLEPTTQLPTTQLPTTQLPTQLPTLPPFSPPIISLSITDCTFNTGYFIAIQVTITNPSSTFALSNISFINFFNDFNLISFSSQSPGWNCNTITMNGFLNCSTDSIFILSNSSLLFNFNFYSNDISPTDTTVSVISALCGDNNNCQSNSIILDTYYEICTFNPPFPFYFLQQSALRDASLSTLQASASSNTFASSNTSSSSYGIAVIDTTLFNTGSISTPSEIYTCSISSYDALFFSVNSITCTDPFDFSCCIDSPFPCDYWECNSTTLTCKIGGIIQPYSSFPSLSLSVNYTCLTNNCSLTAFLECIGSSFAASSSSASSFLSSSSNSSSSSTSLFLPTYSLIQESNLTNSPSISTIDTKNTTIVTTIIVITTAATIILFFLFFLLLLLHK